MGIGDGGRWKMAVTSCGWRYVRKRSGLPLIKKHVATSTIISTDSWKSYDCITNHGYEYPYVNHSDPDNPFGAEWYAYAAH